MKKILAIILSFFLCGMAAFSQTSFNQTTSNPTGAITNTSVDTMNITLSASRQSVAIQPVVTKASGTMAGTITLYYSVNGTNYVATGDTFTLTNVTTNTTVFNLTGKAAKYWRITVGGATTVTGTCTAKISVTNQ